MIFPDVTIEEWLKKHPELSPPDYSKSCHECGKPVHTYRPYIEKDWIGFASNECECGSGYRAYNEIPNSQDSKNLLKNAFQEYLQ